MHRLRRSGLLLCDLGVLWWQSCDNSYNFSQLITSVAVAEPEPVLFGRSRCEGKAPAPDSGFTLDKTDVILNDILFVCSNID